MSNPTRYRTAMAMLLVWLFTLASGMANACTLQNTGTHGHAQVNEGVAMLSAPGTVDITAGHLGAVASHDGDTGLAQPPCLKACDEGTHSLITKVPSGLDQTDSGIAPFTTTIWIAVPSAYAAIRRDVVAQALHSGLPASLRFARLAL